MRANNVRDCWAVRQAAASAWPSIGNSYSADIIGWTGVDCVTVDLQRGMTDVQAMIETAAGMQAVEAMRVRGLRLRYPEQRREPAQDGGYARVAGHGHRAAEPRDIAGSVLH